MRTLNVARMRRHVARTTPSVLRVELDTFADEDWVRERFDWWSRRMTVKHGDRPSITVRTWDDPARMTRWAEARVETQP